MSGLGWSDLKALMDEQANREKSVREHMEATLCLKPGPFRMWECLRLKGHDGRCNRAGEKFQETNDNEPRDAVESRRRAG